MMGQVGKRVTRRLRQVVPARNSSREYLTEFAERASQSTAPGSLVLDAGSGGGPYRSCFAQHRYESADFENAPGVDYVCDLARTPIQADRYDLVVCTQVLEHVPNPGMVLSELYRLLKPGAQLWLSTPLFYEEHMQPYDFFRYTRFGLTRLFEDAGFVVSEITELEGYYGSLSYQMAFAAANLPLSPKQYGGGVAGLIGAAVALLLIPTCSLLSRFYAGFDRRKKLVGHLCKNYCVVGTKAIHGAIS
jgi:SAM-dependent methyltransferase